MSEWDTLSVTFTSGREEMEQFWKMETMGLHQSDIQFCSQQQPSTPIITDKNFWLIISEVEVEVEVEFNNNLIINS